MSEIEALHEQAVDLAEEAFAAQRKGESDKATELFLKALELEDRAAATFPTTPESEPTRSILYRSAASLAYHAKDYDRAEQLIARGLSGYPPVEIKEELRALQDDVNFQHHISVRETVLADHEMQIMLWGDVIGHGVISAELLLKRVEQIRTIFYRTAERLNKFAYRTFGPPSPTVMHRYGLFVNAFHEGSFGVSFSVGEPAQQLDLAFGQSAVPPEEIIEEVINCFEMLQENELTSLQSHIGDNNYYQNFIGMSKQIAPDGNDIKGFSLASKRRSISFRKTRKDISSSEPSDDVKISGSPSENRRVRLEGHLKAATSLTDGQTGKVQIVDKNKKARTVRVPLGQMQDIVQPYYEEYVVITGYRKGNSILFEDIESGDINSSEISPVEPDNDPSDLSLLDLIKK